VLEAPGKDFIYVAGSFNNWLPTSTHLMNKNTSGTKFWLELTGLTPGQIYTYQYWVADQTPTTNSPNIVKTADPCSTLVYHLLMIAEFLQLLTLQYLLTQQDKKEKLQYYKLDKHHTIGK